MTATPAALAVVVRAQSVLLVRRRNPPDAGLWGYPGGRVEPGETAFAAAVRELFEETCVVAVARRTLDIVEVRAEGFAYDLVPVVCEYVSGDPVAADDALDADWVSFDEVRSGRRAMSDRVHDVLAEALRR